MGVLEKQEERASQIRNPMSYDVILLDDDPLINLIHSKIMRLRFPTATPKIFTYGLDALEYLSKDFSENYLIFLDINMPEKNGWQFLETIKDLQIISIEVVIVSSSIDINNRKTAKNYPLVTNYISKPLK